MIVNKIDSIIVETAFYEDVLKSELLLKDDLGIDSLGIVELLVKLEQAFNIEFDESDLDPQKIQTVGDLHNLINNYVNKKDYDI